MNSVTTEILMQLVDGYVETRHECGRPEYNERSALARKLVAAGIESLVKAATPRLFDLSKGIPPATAALPTIEPHLLEAGK
jgi:hypothetical protein